MSTDKEEWTVEMTVRFDAEEMSSFFDSFDPLDITPLFVELNEADDENR